MYSKARIFGEACSFIVGMGLDQNPGVKLISLAIVGKFNFATKPCISA